MTDRKGRDKVIVWSEVDEVVNVISFVVPFSFFDLVHWNVEVIALLRENEDEIGCLAFAIKDEGVAGLDTCSSTVLSARSFPGLDG